MMHRFLVHSFLLAMIGVAQAGVTAYGPQVQQPLGAATAPVASYPGTAFDDSVVLTPPPVPNPPPPTSFKVQLQTETAPDLSIPPRQGSFFGFSIEPSVITQVRAALVFLSDQALPESDQGPTMTLATTVSTKLHNTATIDPAARATSNGNKGLADSLAGTSQGGAVNSAFGLSRALPGIGALIAGAVLIIRMTHALVT